MTLAFTFKIKDALVIVADKKAVSHFKAESQIDLSVFSDSIEKIKEINKNLFFVGAGEQDTLDLLVDNSRTCSNFREFEVNLGNQSSIEGEEFLVIEKETQKGFKIKRDPQSKIFKVSKIKKSVNCNNFIGTYNENTRLGEIKEELTNINNLKFSDIGDRFYDFCNRCLGNIAVDNLHCVGHPLIHGSDIWVISKKRIKKISAHPKREYKYHKEVKKYD